MKRIHILLLFVLSLSAVRASAAWNLAPCGPAGAAQQARQKNLILAAKPGMNHWLPAPYPKQKAAVVRDFQYQFLDVSDRDGAPSRDRVLVTLIRDEMVEFEVYEVANWRANRCLSPLDGDLQWLLLLRHKDTHVELARANLHESGQLESFSVADDDDVAARARLAKFPIPDVARALDEASARGIHGREPQLITAWGELRCPELFPCVAFRADADILIQRGVELYRFTPMSRRLSFSRDLASETGRSNATGSHGRGQKLMSLGGDQFVVVEMVP